MKVHYILVLCSMVAIAIFATIWSSLSQALAAGAEDKTKEGDFVMNLPKNFSGDLTELRASLARALREDDDMAFTIHMAGILTEYFGLETVRIKSELDPFYSDYTMEALENNEFAIFHRRSRSETETILKRDEIATLTSDGTIQKITPAEKALYLIFHTGDRLYYINREKVLVRIQQLSKGDE